MHVRSLCQQVRRLAVIDFSTPPNDAIDGAKHSPSASTSVNLRSLVPTTGWFAGNACASGTPSSAGLLCESGSPLQCECVKRVHGHEHGLLPMNARLVVGSEYGKNGKTPTPKPPLTPLFARRAPFKYTDASSNSIFETLGVNDCSTFVPRAALCMI